MIIVTRVEGSNEIIIMVIYIINVRRPVSKVQDRLDEWSRHQRFLADEADRRRVSFPVFLFYGCHEHHSAWNGALMFTNSACMGAILFPCSFFSMQPLAVYFSANLVLWCRPRRKICVTLNSTDPADLNLGCRWPGPEWHWWPGGAGFHCWAMQRGEKQEFSRCLHQEPQGWSERVTRRWPDSLPLTWKPRRNARTWGRVHGVYGQR